MKLFIGLALVLLVLAFVAVLQVRKRQQQQKLQGLKWIQALRMLLTHVQKHRGISTAFLSGNWNVDDELAELKSSITRDIAAVSTLGDWINQHDDWEGITRHWARLGGASENLLFPKNFSQHCKIIANILALLDGVARAHKLSDGMQASMWHELLWVAELIGQCRALGVRILSIHDKNPHQVKQKQQIQKSLNEVNHLLEATRLKKYLSAEQLSAVNNFVGYAQLNLLENVGVISAQEYFNQATATIDLIYECFDREMQALHRKIAD